MAEIELSDVTKTYPDGHRAVRGVSLSIGDGEFVVLVGPSGCGKSTTLRMISGLEEITSGTISIAGRVVNAVAPKDRDIAMVFQNYALYPHMTVSRNLDFALRLRRVPKAEIERRVAGAAKMLGITELLHKKPGALSGGQRQRVAVGRAIVREPKAFLFDEPLSNLDARLRVTTRAEIKSLQMRLETTTVYVTHDQEEAMTLGDRVVVMHAGIVRQAGPPLELYRRPADRFVAGFIGMPPMNFLDGRLEGADGALWFVEGSADADGRPYRLRLTDATVRLLAGATAATHGPIVLGVRPQALRLAAATHPEAWRLPISLIEPLGDALDVTGSTPLHPSITARVPADADAERLRAGGSAAFTIDPAATLLFEPGDLGRRLAP